MFGNCWPSNVIDILFRITKAVFAKIVLGYLHGAFGDSEASGTLAVAFASGFVSSCNLF